MIVEIEIVFRLVLALILGSAIGYERKVHNKAAGMRTHALVCVGSTLFAVLSTFTVQDPSSSARIAAGLITGLGFLGAGMIFRNETRVEGLTTAAEIWVLGAVGLAIGFGYYIIAVAASVIVVFILVPEEYLEAQATRKRLRKKDAS